MREPQVVQLIKPPFEGSPGLARELDGLTVTIDTSLLGWSLLPENEGVVYIRNHELEHALIAQRGAHVAAQYRDFLKPRQATAFPISCCDQTASTTLSELKSGTYYLPGL